MDEMININQIRVKHKIIPEITSFYSEKQKIQNGLHYDIHINDSIHMNSIKTNNYDLYETYITKTDQKEHSVDIFKNLLNNFDLNKMKPIQVKYLKYGNENYYIVQDGVHRLSIMLFKQIFVEFIPRKYFKIIK